MSDMTVNLEEFVPGTGIGEDEVYAIGRIVLNVIGSVVRIGHSSPAEHLDYMHPKDIPSYIVRDFILWCSRRTDMDRPDAEARLRELIVSTGWLKQQEMAADADLANSRRSS